VQIRLLPILFTLITLSTQAQDLLDLQMELKGIREKVMKSRSDAEKLELNREFTARMRQLAETEDYFDDQLDSIPKIGVVFSPDRGLKLIGWNVALEDQSFQYYTLLIKNDKKAYQVFFLNDKSDDLTQVERSQLNMNQWFGALYYEVIPFKHGGQKKYLLLAWDGHTAYSNKKVVEVLKFEEGVPTFGDQVFGEPYSMNKRILFEYSSKAVMSMNYDDKLDMVVFDHLTPLQPNLEGMHEFYVPDLSFDGLEYRGGSWRYVEDVDFRGKRSMKNYNPPPK
jgi:hypothetical protein